MFVSGFMINKKYNTLNIVLQKKRGTAKDNGHLHCVAADPPSDGLR